LDWPDPLGLRRRELLNLRGEFFSEVTCDVVERSFHIVLQKGKSIAKLGSVVECRVGGVELNLQAFGKFLCRLFAVHGRICEDVRKSHGRFDDVLRLISSDTPPAPSDGVRWYPARSSIKFIFCGR
jgi:hypothetical protein